MSLEWETLERLTRDGELDKLTGVLVEAAEERRVAFAGEFETRIKAMGPEQWWQAGENPVRGYALIAVGCLPTAARAAAMLCRRQMRDNWSMVPTDRFLEIAHARALPWLGDLGVRLADRVSPREPWSGEWLFAAALLRAGNVDPPVTEGVVRGWFNEMRLFQTDGKPVPMVDRLRDSPYLDLLLPSLFTIDGLGSDLNVGHHSPESGSWQSAPAFPSAVARLVAEGRLDRRQIIGATVDRLVRGDRPAWLRPFAMLHDALAPTADELAGHTLDYAQLLPDAPATIATLAQRALRALDDDGRVELETVLEASRPVLVRKEKGLVKAQLSWLEKVARREPDRAAEVLETVAVALDHPALDIKERAQTLLDRHGAKPALPAPARPPANRTLPPPAPPAAMPPPIADAVELAEEVVALFHDESGVRWERVLAGIVALRTTALADVLDPILDRHANDLADRRWNETRLVLLGEALNSILRPHRHGNAWHRLLAAVRAAREEAPVTRNPLIATPGGALALRIAELAVEVMRKPVPELVATPSLVNGSLDAETLLSRLRRAESEGWQPWPADFEQALLRVPRPVDDTVLAGAGRLTSAAGRQFAGWLAAGGLPDPTSTRMVQQSPTGRRVMVNLQPARAGGLLENHLTSLERRPQPQHFGYDLIDHWGILPMVSPHHREISAAWSLTTMAGLADQDNRGGGSVLLQLAEGAGPIGPAMTLAMTYAFGARHESDRVAAVDAFLALAGGDAPFTAAMGADVGDLCADGTVKLNRVVLALTDAHRAGASVAVWEVLAVAVPLLLPHTPRGLPDLLELATLVASEVGAQAEIANLAEAAAKPGSTRLAREATRLRAVLGG
ncbi:hypothetical protein DMB66_37325 [Actinoplanes sp. ATCC 53533]|uniref:DUF6493 family protein n=1 Tax=Actinoplanes sp. ATCC 53533 TaxID=1288362 RepID=UPI000F79D17D|nr:DUF6493 family protein [Actinoplanes sp. ATCC 53533]RSM54693.1 hypothetical protein DMB66_37325 [Actinoplanes sp. ATCC 53533]